MIELCYYFFMTTMITEIYDAFIDAGASEVKARKAAEAVSHAQEDMKEIKVKLNLLLTLVIPVFLVVFGKFLLSLLD